MDFISFGLGIIVGFVITYICCNCVGNTVFHSRTFNNGNYVEVNGTNNNSVNININGQKICGSGIYMRNGRLFINGEEVKDGYSTDKNPHIYKVTIDGSNGCHVKTCGSVQVNGSCNSVSTTGTVNVQGDSGNIITTGSVTVGGNSGFIRTTGRVTVHGTSR